VKKSNICENLAACLILLAAPALAQRELSGSARVYEALHSLANTGSVLMIAAHPDDENTALLAYFARGLCVRTAYLSLTRGEGGQNLLGPEQGDALGVIRTQELLAARRVDGAEQFFTRAIDFGFSKTADESMQKWGRERTLSDIVRVIRRFRPDVIVLRFSGTPRDGHGHHQASAILGKEAFFAAADAKQFPECGPSWQAKRLMWNMFGFTREQQAENEKASGKVQIDDGIWNPVLGLSYLEIAGMSRSMHRSQGMGSPERRGSNVDSLIVVAGEPVQKSIFDGVDITWNRFPGGGPVGELLERAWQTFDPAHPEKVAPLLAEAKHAMPPGDDPLLKRKQHDLDEAIALCAGLWVDATADDYAVVPGGKVKVTLTGVNRGPLAIQSPTFKLEPNQPDRHTLEAAIPANAAYSGPYWLLEAKHGDSYEVGDPSLIGTPENAPLLSERMEFNVAGAHIELDRPVVYRWVDRLLGERWRPLAVVPPVAMSLPESSVIFADNALRTVAIDLKAVQPERGEARVLAPWKTEPKATPFVLKKDEETSMSFEVSPPAAQEENRATAEVRAANTSLVVSTELIDYPHIPPQYLFPLAAVKLVRVDVVNLAKNVGYVMGAGDDVPDSLRQMGSTVTLLNAEDLARGDLGRFDAIVTGVRAYNTRADLGANEQRLVDYVQSGGTLVVQYNTMDAYSGEGGGVLDHAGPWPLQIGHERVTVEESPVAFPHPENPLLHKPNEITERDFDGWIQERGLYFASTWDKNYQPLFETHDPGEQPLLGATLSARYGKGAFVFTAFSWFRELPAGVPGAFRIFANLLSAGKTLP
jgi:LmbE family N-acetylglucosaminyl deacetylase